MLVVNKNIFLIRFESRNGDLVNQKGATYVDSQISANR